MQTHSPEDSAAWAPLMHDAPAAEPVPETRLHRILEAGSKALGMCGHGKPLNWSVRFADALFVDCGCCWCLRCAFVGGLFGAAVTGLAWFITRLL